MISRGKANSGLNFLIIASPYSVLLSSGKAAIHVLHMWHRHLLDPSLVIRKAF